LIAVNMLAQLRAQGVRCDMSFGDRAMKGAMKAADKSGAPVVLIIGEDELAAGIVTVKNMQDGVQSTVPLADVVTLVSAMAQINPSERQPRS
jgi:histidyl-tRNA synthetase